MSLTKSKFIIGIDLGTTNSAVAYIKRQSSEEIDFPTIELYEIPQLVAPGEGAPLRTLPSFLYIAGEYDIAAESLWLPWDETIRYAVGTFAREQGALVPNRLVNSAKSWLCYPEVDRRAKILPWGSDLGVDARSPVEASTLYLKHIRDSWNYEFGEDIDSRFENQEIVLTVPASFDEEARELTVEAAREAGFTNLTLLEEPLAAFYSWVVTNHESFEKYVADKEIILICDVGGGTSDFSLIKVSRHNDEVKFERTAVGEHLLLGGDNVDYSLTYQIQNQITSKLTLQQRAALLRQSCSAKEKLLADDSQQEITINIAGSGSSLVGGLVQATLTRSQVLDLILEGFLPITELTDLAKHERRSGLREIGLPYESDPAITRHLAEFLNRAGGESGPIRPDAILFNGGFFKPQILRVRLAEALMNWFDDGQGWLPKMLSNDALDTAVAIGAAYYGSVRSQGGIRVGSGSARAYYIGINLDSPTSEEQVTVVCALPRGTEEGTRLVLDSRRFELQANRPVSFTLWSSNSRQGDALGDLITTNVADLHAHSPLVTVIRFGKRSTNIDIPVKVVTEFTEVGTLEIWCESQISEHRWRLQFQLRKDTTQVRNIRKDTGLLVQTHQIIADEAMEKAKTAIFQVFGSTANEEIGKVCPINSSPVELLGKLEETLGIGRDSWPLEIIRKLSDSLIEVSEGRRLGEKFEARWLNLYGFCLRPGFGDPVDDWRLQQARKLYHRGLYFIDDEQCQAEWLVLWRRVCGGFTKGQQIDFYERYATQLIGSRTKKRIRLNQQVERESWRALASMELLPIQNKIELGNALISRIQQGQMGENEFWSLGRIGARIPFYATIDTVVPPAVVTRWIESILNVNSPSQDSFVAALAQLGAKTNDHARDINDNLRKRIVGKIQEIGKQLYLIENVESYLPAKERDATRIFGESLPLGLKLIE